ncbi:hypothetical protein HMPREF1981_02751 [Bacteroides pyogenes F0041]|uniref:Uncharacterized protein n=1 Tax=Bacteroides pyogenes F0041 TaxID=1321819 RepID=U2CBS1_9BACE|nr:hypothetical protein HMPREF1981_02751 [Bacteroides pyogenes F0041]
MNRKFSSYNQSFYRYFINICQFITFAPIPKPQPVDAEHLSRQ